MQVAMIQSMLPYVAWPVRVSLEMDEDFTSARRTIKQNSLDWAGTVDVILTILLKHNALESWIVQSTNFEDTIPLLLFIIYTFGAPKQIISDNAICFTGVEARRFQQSNSLKFTHTTPARPQGNGKVKQANGILKGIFSRTILENKHTPLQESLARAVSIFNRRMSPAGYSPYFLLFGTQPPEEEQIYPMYTRESTEQEEADWSEELVKIHVTPIAQNYVNSMRAARAKTREYLQEKKALLRTFAPGDWVLRVRQRRHKFEPYYDGPWAISACHSGNTYSLISPGGYKMINRYNGSNLFPAYSRDGHRVRSLWYDSQRMLNQDRKNLKLAVRLRETEDGN
ncbi:putative tkp3 protein [Erysiphe necator]|uniref:Putative tkp3 protein n=1 Tax=Uncinula necator TaxID=52586 RepID=A0A0B1PED3_UNCNE|nr:putative tkp3 protein [Erysiphe necator]